MPFELLLSRDGTEEIRRIAGTIDGKFEVHDDTRTTPMSRRVRPAAIRASRRRACHARGFTLIEVLAALVIVGLGMLGVILAVIQAARNGTYLREKTLAHWIAMNLDDRAPAA